MSQLHLRKKLKIENVRKEEWAGPEGNQWARENLEAAGIGSRAKGCGSKRAEGPARFA